MYIKKLLLTLEPNIKQYKDEKQLERKLIQRSTEVALAAQQKFIKETALSNLNKVKSSTEIHKRDSLEQLFIKDLFK
jgi:hypothetical protein